MPISPIDLIAPFDPTVYPSISGAQLLQLISGAYPYTDKGLVIVTNDVAGNPQAPDADDTLKWANYIWVRIADPSAFVYVWNPNVDRDEAGGLLRWQPVSLNLASGSVEGTAIKAGTIPATALAGNIDFETYVIGFPTAMGGDLSGTYPNPTIKALAIGPGELADDAVIASKLATGSIDPITNKLVIPAGSSGKVLAIGATSTVAEWLTLPTIARSAAVVTTANALKIPQVETAGAGDTGTWRMRTVDEIVAASALAASYTLLSGVDTAVIAANKDFALALGFAAAPSFVRVVLVCISDDTGANTVSMAAGTEIEISNVYITGGDSAAVVYSTKDAVTVKLRNSANFISVTISGTAENLTNAKWKIKVYARA